MPEAKVDPVKLLKDDHKKVKDLLSRAEKKPTQELIDEITMELQVHTKVEEEIFYPAFKKVDEELVMEAIEEHHVVDTLLEEIAGLSPDDDVLAAKLTVLRENVEHHIEEEEGKMFPDAKEVEGLEDIGQQMKQRKEELTAQMEGASKSKARSSRRR